MSHCVGNTCGGERARENYKTRRKVQTFSECIIKWRWRKSFPVFYKTNPKRKKEHRSSTSSKYAAAWKHSLRLSAGYPFGSKAKKTDGEEGETEKGHLKLNTVKPPQIDCPRVLCLVYPSGCRTQVALCHLCRCNEWERVFSKVKDALDTAAITAGL